MNTKEIMNIKEFKFAIKYYCQIDKDLELTNNFVEHSTENQQVYSINFAKIILIARAEFENRCKQLCDILEEGDHSKIDFKKFTKIILKHCPDIVKAEFECNGMKIKPLDDWKVYEKEEFEKSKWNVYNKLKHNMFLYFSDATLENAIKSVASLQAILLLIEKICGYDECINCYIVSNYTRKIMSVARSESIPS